MSKHKATTRGRVGGMRRARNQNKAFLAARFRAADGLLMLEKPFWTDRTGELFWKGQVVLELSRHAYSARAVLTEFQRLDWQWVIRDPMARAAIGDPTQERRRAIYNLKKHQRPKEILRFFSIRGGLIGWCDAQWLGRSKK